MFDNINNDGILNHSSVNSQAKIAQLSANKQKQAYSTKPDLIDESDISDDALAKYEHEQEIKRYKDIVMNMLQSDNSSTSKVDEVKNMIANNNYQIDEKTLAAVLANDNDLLSMLF